MISEERIGKLILAVSKIMVSFFFRSFVGRACRFFLRAFTGLAWRSQGKSINEHTV
jgi:hypothetical protein